MTQPTHVSGTIKPLEWEGPDLESDFRAHHQFGWYVIYIIDRGHLLSRDGVVAGVFGTADAAKAAAQADYEARIAAQIQPDAEAHPSDGPEEWREIEQDYQPCITDGYTGIRISKPGFWFVKGPGPASSFAAHQNQDHAAHPALSDEGEPQASEAGDLLPCPFCAGKARVIRGVDGFYPPTAECDECGVRMKAPECLTGKLIAAWNLRALPAARAEVSTAEAARVLLGDGDTMPSKAKLAAVSAYCRLEGLARPVAITDAWNAALRALTEAGE